MKLEKIGNDLIANTIVQLITKSIINGDLKPGEKLPTEMELVEKLGVGRNSIREAIKMLLALGILEVKRGSGTFVATKTSEALFNPLLFSLILEPGTSENLYELRVMFETIVLNIAIERAFNTDIEAMENCLERVRLKLKEGNWDVDEFVKEDLTFHELMLKATHNPLIERIGKIIVDLYPQYMRKSLRQANGITRNPDNHATIVNAIKSRNKQSTREVIEKSLEDWKVFFIETDKDNAI